LSRQIRENLRRLNTRSVLLFPLTTSGQWNGAIAFHFESPGVLDRSDIRHVQGLVDQAAVAIHNMRLLENEVEARREAEKANELKLKLLAMISHELRTPPHLHQGLRHHPARRRRHLGARDSARLYPHPQRGG
jgi:GAF domain-containing protein